MQAEQAGQTALGVFVLAACVTLFMAAYSVMAQAEIGQAQVGGAATPAAAVAPVLTNSLR